MKGCENLTSIVAIIHKSCTYIAQLWQTSKTRQKLIEKFVKLTDQTCACSDSTSFEYVENSINDWKRKLRTIHLRRRQFFTIFDPYPPTVGSFLLLSVGKFCKFLTPPPPNKCRLLKWMVPYGFLKKVPDQRHR